MGQHYSALEQWLLDQELVSLDKILVSKLESMVGWWDQLMQGKLPDNATPFRWSIPLENKNLELNQDQEQGQVNHFRLEVLIIRIKTEDVAFNTLIKDEWDKGKVQSFFTSTMTYIQWYGFALEDGDKDPHVVNAVKKYHELLEPRYQQLLINNDINDIFVRLRVQGPVLYRLQDPKEIEDDSDSNFQWRTSGGKIIGDDTDYHIAEELEELDEFYDESLSSLLNHPFVKLPRIRISSAQTPIAITLKKVQPVLSGRDLLLLVKKELIKVQVITGDKVTVALYHALVPLYQRWTTDRKSIETTKKQLDALYPILTSVQFLSQLREWTTLGREIVTQTNMLNKQIRSMTQNTLFDIQTIELLVKSSWETEQKPYVTREELLDRWVEFIIERGDDRTADYLKKNILRPRLAQAMEQLKNDRDLQYKVRLDTLQTGKAGKPTTIFMWKEKR